jgi:hypothetical protein
MSRRTARRRLCILAATACAAATLTTTPAAARDIAGSWRFDEGAGLVAADSGPFGLHGTFPAVGGPMWLPGVEGTALRFDGGEGVALPDDPALEPARITVAAWVRARASPGAYRYIISKGASSCRRSAYGLYTGPGGGGAFFVAGDGSYTVSPQAPPALVWDGRWHRLTGSYDGVRVRLYLDGAPVGSETGPSHIEYGLDSRAPFIGTYRGTCQLPFQGDLDNLSVWREALPASVIGDDAQPPPETPAGGPIGPAPAGPRLGDPGFKVDKGFTATPSGCTSVTVSRRSVRAARRTVLVATVDRGSAPRAGVRVVLRAQRLRKVARTDARGRVRFIVRAAPRHRRLAVRVATTTPPDCGTPVAFVRVRPRG